MLLDITTKIDPTIATVLADLAEPATDSEIEFLVVGAMARDMILEYGFGIEAGRATRDIDFGVRVADWQAFEQLVNLLRDDNWRCLEQQHRLVHESGIPVDLIPFGAIESDDGNIRWPPHFNEALSVTGFSDAYADCWHARIRREPALDIPVASPAGQALLKLVAWRDRGLVRGGRDAIDLRLLMERYLDLDNIDRVAEEHLDWLDDDFDYRIVGAKLLGVDVARCARNVPEERVTALLDALQPERPERTIAFFFYCFGEDVDLHHCQRLVDAFCSTLRI
ncbi:MAG: nucleotidyl transferase AbiEii/AbiGii toxin family protein, partial [Rhodospirillaceae bacterium]|nr:nucleotidyl transferase AbiEii/AbiGii toxin family protein [Rhodospirillaceae bacterium]